MYLKAIEVQGFKSFANKINFEFHNGITCIVGPNGSGKSNVADAVRWVLGEQSAKQLRGANMQDVIFSGTEIRKPQGYAYVAITLDNSDHKLAIDYSEVTVSRRVYRSGESEYKINGATARLRDVQELFYDTGIGKEGYSIIGQGQIDKILSNKPDERRELFDEAVGIVKYKRRKKETLKKLDSEHSNLVRVTDILSELEKQVGPLFRQSENAKRYLALYDEQKKCDMECFTLDYQDSHRRLDENEKNTAIVEGDLEQVTGQGEALRESFASVNNRALELDRELADETERFNDIRGSISQDESRALVLGEQLKTENINKEHVTERLQALSEEEVRLNADIEEYKNQAKENADTCEQLTDREQDMLNIMSALDVRIKNHERMVEQGKARLITLLNQKSDASAKLTKFATLEQQLLLRRGELSAQSVKLSGEYEEAKLNLARQESELLQINDAVAEQRKAIAGMEEKRSALMEKIRDFTQKKQEAQQNYRVAASRAESLKNLDERYEGYQNSIRRVMDYAKKNSTGVLGVVSDLVHVDRGYETAIEIALGGSIQNIVTDTSRTAKSLIAYLKTNKFGRATFLPLDAFGKKTEFPVRQALNEEGVLGVASDLVSVDDRFKNAISYLLGRTLVADNIDHAASIAKKYRYSIRIVTLEGDLLSPGGSMTGGTYKNSSNLLGRKNEIAELENSAKDYKKTASGCEKELSVCQKEFDSIDGDYKKFTISLQSLVLDQKTAQLSLDQQKKRQDELVVMIADIRSQANELESQIGSLRVQKGGQEKNLNDIENKNSDSEKSITDDERKLEEARQNKERLTAEHNDVLLELARLKQKGEFIQENTDRLKEQLSRNALEKDQQTKKESDIDRAVDEINSEMSMLETRLLESRKARALSQSSLDEINAEKQSLSGSQKEFFEKQQEITSRQKDLEVELMRLHAQKEKLDEHLDERTNYLWTEYEMLPSQAMVSEDSISLTMTELRRKIIELKGSIRALGSVDVNSIEQYKEVSGRYEFMKSQYEDLTKAEDQLKGIIDELDEGMRKQFNEQFARIQTEFDRVFSELFGGGHGRLELVEDEDVIEAGIRIISQPPGKKLSNMMQLSGGEKALTAIALLFAIQNLKPSPFCLLDEIEAALDDANVSRFAGYLRKLTEHTQFILISHRRGTMVMADRLYGITMQEKGVSTLVSVNLIEQELDN